jgi:flagellar hook-associated protein FlgK
MQIKRNNMSKTEMLNKLSTCISIMQDTDNTYVTRQLEEIAEELVKQWNESDMYLDQIRQELNYEIRMNHPI